MIKPIIKYVNTETNVHARQSLNSNIWIVSCIFGPMYFWSKENRWEIVINKSPKEIEDLGGWTFGEAMLLLEKVKHVKER